MSDARYIALVVAAALGGCADHWTPATPSPNAQSQPSASLFDRPWVWLDDQGNRVTFAQWRGTDFVLAAIYTSCQETCPRTLAKLREVYDQYGRDHRRAEFVVVTIDPETDTPDRLRELRKSRGLPEAWHLLTGGSQETQELADVLGVHLMDMESHLVHDSKIMLFDAAGRSVSELDIL